MCTVMRKRPYSKALQRLQQANLRPTRQRLALGRLLFDGADRHVTAEQLHAEAMQARVSVSLATVYNTLELLTECHLVARHQFGNNKARYERAYSFWQHDHLICIECNAIFEFCDPRLQSVQEMVEEVFGFSVERHALHMYGHCRRENCPNRSENGAGNDGAA